MSALTRKKVLSAAEELGYSPNAIARSLITSTTRIVGIVTAGLDNPSYAASLEAINTLLQERGFASLVFIAHELENTDDLVARLIKYRVDALILTAAPLSSNVVDQCTRANMPVVLFGRYTETDLVTTVVSDNVQGGCDVAEFLVGCGHRQIAFIAGLDETSDGRDRARGFHQHMIECGKPDYLQVPGFFSYDGATTATRRLLDGSRRPDAIFCANDVMAAAALDVVRDQLGLRVPEDVAIVGYDNSSIARWPAYSITSVDGNIPDMARLAVDAVVEASGSPRSEKRITVAPRLIRRRSA